MDDSRTTSELGSRRERLEDLLAELMRAADGGQSVDPRDWVARYPDFAAEIDEFFHKQLRVDGLLRPLQSAVARVLHVRCPHCHNQIELLDDSPLHDLSCPTCGSAFSLVDPQAAPSLPTSSKTIAHFELLEHVGVGQFGSVWKARDTKLDRVVALKIPRHMHLDEAQTQLFFRDARAAAQLKHPNIVSVHEVGRKDGTTYIVSDFIAGATLKEWAADRRPTPREAAALCVKLARALQHAHDCGVVHRDLKPGNVMMDADGEPHVVDFGLAKRDAGEITMTVEGQILGTPAYMSPEQARGEGHGVDGRADVYSLGVMLFELLTGELPFRGEKHMLIHQILQDEPPNPRKLDGTISKDLETLILRCLEKDPRRRYNAEQLEQELHRFLIGEPIHARPVGRITKVVRWSWRHPGAAALISLITALLLVMAIGGTAMAVHQSKQATQLKRQGIVLQDQRKVLQKREQDLLDVAEQLRQKNIAQERQAGTLKKQTEILQEQTAKLTQQTMQLEQQQVLLQRRLYAETSSRIAADAQRIPDEYPIRKLLVAAEAVNTNFREGEPVTPDAHEMLLNAVASCGGRPLIGPETTVEHVAVGPYARWVATSSGRSVLLWDRSGELAASKELDVHPSDVSYLGIGQRGKWLGAVGVNGVVRLWKLDSAEPRQVSHELHHEVKVTAAYLTGNSHWLVTAGDDGSVLAWDLSNEPPKSHRLNGVDQPVRQLVVDPAGRYLFAARAKSIRRWDLLADEPRATQQDVAESHLDVTHIAASRNGWLVWATDDGTVQLLDHEASKSGKPRLTLRDVGVRLTSLVIDPWRSFVAASDENGVAYRWNLHENRNSGLKCYFNVLPGHENSVSSIHLTANSRRLVAKTRQTPRVWSHFGRSASPRVLRGHEDRVLSMALSAGGRWLATGDLRGTTRIWDLRGTSGVLRYRHATPGFVEFTPDSRRLIMESWSPEGGGAIELSEPLASDYLLIPSRKNPGVAGRWMAHRTKDRIQIVDLLADSPKRPVKVIPDTTEIGSITHDGRWLVTYQRRKRLKSSWILKRWDLHANEPTNTLRTIAVSESDAAFFDTDPYPVRDPIVRISGNGRWVTMQIGNGKVHLWDAAAADFSNSMLDIPVTVASLSSDSRWMATAGPEGIRLWDLQVSDDAPPNPITLKPGGRYVRWVQFSPDGRWLIASRRGEGLSVWDLQQPSAESIHTLLGDPGDLRLVAASSVRGRLVGAGTDNTVYVWNLQGDLSKQRPIVLPNPGSRITSLNATPNGRWLIAGRADGTLRLCDLAATHPRRSTRELKAHDRAVTALVVSPDSRWMVTCTNDKTARLWALDVARLLRQAWAVAGRKLTNSEQQEYLWRHATNDDTPSSDEVYSSDLATAAAPAKDWPMWAGSPSRNMFSTASDVAIDFQPDTKETKARNLLWSAKVGSQTYGSPVVADGRVFVGTNNGGGYRDHSPAEEDRGVLLCFDEETGAFLWQLTRHKLPTPRVNDWPEQGIASMACVEGERLWICTNRAELMCVDTRGFRDGENDGPYCDEVYKEEQDADIVWSLDMIEQLGVFPHNLAISSPVVHGDLVFLITGNGIDEAHQNVPAPRAPAFLAVNKNTGKVVWEDNSPLDRVLHGQWSSPTIGIVNGQAQVYMAGGDGWLYAFEAETGKLVWKFDLNPKDSKWELGGRGTRNSIIATPVFLQNSVLLACGQDPEHGGGVGHLYRIDATKRGDVSPQLPSGAPNPNSAQMWHFGGVDEDGAITGIRGREIFRRTLSTVAVYDDLVYAADLTGYLHCVDFKSGERYWEYDTFAAIWGSPLVVDGNVWLGDEDGDLVILRGGLHMARLAGKIFPSSIYGTPVVTNGKIFVLDRSKLHVFKAFKGTAHK